MNDDPNKDWESIGKALSNFPIPPPNEGFVQRVMIKIDEEEKAKFSWLDLWKIPALGFGMATLLLAFLTAVWRPSHSIDSYLLAGVSDPIVSQWVSGTDGSKTPETDEVLQFTMEEL